LKLSSSELVEIATAVGQDVPFLLEGGTARATGLGSTVSPLPPVPSSWRFLVVCPPIKISTQAVFDVVDGGAPSARRTPALIAALESHFPPPLAREGRVGAFGNDLESASRRVFPALDDAINRLRDAVPGFTMSGTGAALFALFDRRQDAERSLNGIRRLGYPAWLCRPIPAAA
jgi:4-diphosphocytidyl-2-C-methyl-D-erythritol kinase